MGKFAVVNVESKNLLYGGKNGVTKRQAEDAFQDEFMKQARKKRFSKYAKFKGIEFRYF